MALLKNIHSHKDLLDVAPEKIPTLCDEIRGFLLEKVSKNGGHLASNLGAVELTVALHRVYDPMVDRILFDVGHQSYVHKMLSGRMDQFDSLRKLDGISGFPKPCESVADAFIAGHASESISLGLGMARARTLKQENYNVCVVIGDGAMTGGLSFEGLCDAGTSGEPLVVILNDNGMSIKESVGGMAAMLSRARLRPGYLKFKQSYREVMKHAPALYRFTHDMKEHLRDKILPTGMFDEMGFYYVGPIDGHDEELLEETIRWARDLRQPVLIHVVTVKGKGYAPAELHPDLYHGVAPFDLATGVSVKKKKSFSSVFGDAIIDLAEEDDTVCAVTAAMESGTGLDDFAVRFPKRYFELGIAEEHAVSMCAGMARQGMKPVFAVYSTFLQRSYDMLVEDVGLMSNHVVFAVDRAGVVGGDGMTHNGSFDVAYLSSVPGMKIYAPSNYRELTSMLRSAVEEDDGPCAIRYPRGGEGSYQEPWNNEPETLLCEGDDLTIITHGIFVNEALAAVSELAEQGIKAELIKLNVISPLPREYSLRSMKKTGRVIFVEDDCRSGSVSVRMMAFACANGIAVQAVRQLDLGSGIVSHGSPAELYHRLKMDKDGIIEAAREILA